jgi:hypothetical protein
MQRLSDLAQIDGLKVKIERWRQARPKSGSMPEELWQEAGAAAKRLGTNRVARALGLGYEGLKQRVLSKKKGGPRGKEPGEVLAQEAQFIELPGLPMLGSPAGNGEEMVVELVAADGMRLTIRTRQAGAAVVEMISAFRGRP